MTTAPTAVAEGELGRSPAVEIPKNFWKWIQTSLKTLEEHYKSNRDFMLFVRCLDGDSFEDSVLVTTRIYELSLDGETLSIQLQDSDLEIQEKLVTFLRALLGKEHEVAPAPQPMPRPAPQPVSPAPGHRDILVFPGRVTPISPDSGDEVKRIVEDGRRQVRDEIKGMRERVKRDIEEANREVEKAREDFERQMGKVRRRAGGGAGGISDLDTDPNAGPKTPPETPEQATDRRVREFLRIYYDKTLEERHEGVGVDIGELGTTEWDALRDALSEIGFSEYVMGGNPDIAIISPKAQRILEEQIQEELNELCHALSLESKKDATALYEMRADLPRLEQWVKDRIRTRLASIVQVPLKVRTNFANDRQLGGSPDSQEWLFPRAAIPAFRMKLFVEENCIIAQVTSVANRPQPGRGH